VYSWNFYDSQNKSSLFPYTALNTQFLMQGTNWTFKYYLDDFPEHIYLLNHAIGEHHKNSSVVMKMSCISFNELIPGMMKTLPLKLVGHSVQSHCVQHPYDYFQVSAIL
jgi:hypothetical protein